MNNGGMGRTLRSGIMLKIGLPLLLGLVTVVCARAGGMSGSTALALTAAVAFGSALAFFILDTEARLAAADERTAAGLAKLDRSVGLASRMERSILDGQVSPLLWRLAQRETERVTSFLDQLPGGREIAYEGEDRDWLLGLTQEAERSIDAISLSTVDAGVVGLDGGLWTSDLGNRYLDRQREAIARGVRIRRIFVFVNEDLSRDESFLRITEMQRNIGVEVRMLDHQFVPDWMQSMILDFIVFDGVVSYETTPATTFIAGQTRTGQLRTRLAPMPDRVRDLEGKFAQLWETADLDRQIGG